MAVLWKLSALRNELESWLASASILVLSLPMKALTFFAAIPRSFARNTVFATTILSLLADAKAHQTQGAILFLLPFESRLAVHVS